MMVTARRIRLLVIFVTLLSGAGIWYWQSRSDPSQDRYKTQTVDRGDIVQSISANGTLNPVILVNVGTQVSGTVYRLYADFNDRVKAGDVLAELDPALFKAQLRQSEANVGNSHVALKLAQRKMARNRALVEKGFISGDALDTVEQQLEVTRAQLAVDNAQLERDRTNLNYSVIRSPISGIVIARNVDVGQTVAASFQTPTLFQIANDLRRMQIDTSVAEADIGQLHLDQVVHFTVDAFQEREFTGVVKQLRLNPTIQQNVVSYNVVVAVTNEDETLLPGMTANVRFTVDQKRNVLRVPNAVLRYKPAETEVDATPADKPPAGKRLLYRLEQGNRVPIYVGTGIADNNFTEVIGEEIKEGDELIVREMSDKDKSGSKFRFRMF